MMPSPPRLLPLLLAFFALRPVPLLAGETSPTDTAAPAAVAASPTPAASAPTTLPADELPAEEALSGQPADVVAAVKVYRSTGEPPVLPGAVVRHPYGHGQPSMQCLPLRACDIELQPGETITGVALGDNERWLVEPLASGDPAAPTRHVIIKPTEGGLHTNLIIGTTRRTYHISLESPKSNKNGRGQDAYVRRLSFWYPDELVAVWKGAAGAAAAARAARTAVFTIPTDAAALNFDYRIKGDKATWAPLRVFDDRSHLYIQFAAAIAQTDAPVLLAKSDTGQLAVVNYRTSPDGRWYIADGVWPEAHLVVGTGRSQKRVEITNRAYKR